MINNILIVDGYNIIGAWEELRILRDIQLEDARARLVELMAEYKAATGYRVIIVFDAYLSPGVKQTYKESGLEIIYTGKNETADEHIEKLSNELKGRRVQIHVATSDMMEQNVVFFQGALRKSARELEIEMRMLQSKISMNVKKTQESKPVSRIEFSNEQKEQLEKWRRGLQ